MGRKAQFTAAQMIEAINQTKGMVYMAAQALGCSHVTVYNYAKRHPTVQRAIDSNRGHVLDTAELKLYQAILDGESWAVQFVLRTIGRDRGYVERKEVANPQGETLKVTLEWNDGDNDRNAAPIT